MIYDGYDMILYCIFDKIFYEYAYKFLYEPFSYVIYVYNIKKIKKYHHIRRIYILYINYIKAHFKISFQTTQKIFIAVYNYLDRFLHQILVLFSLPVLPVPLDTIFYVA